MAWMTWDRINKGRSSWTTLKAAADRNGKYHDHKETSAWAALVLHFVFCSAFIRFDFGSPLPVWEFVSIFLFVTTESVIVFTLIKWHLNMKDLASATQSAAFFGDDRHTRRRKRD